MSEKKIKQFISTLFAIGLLIMLQTSCKKFVQIPPSNTVVVAANVFDKNSTATAAQLAIYAQMQSYPANIDWATGLSSDEIKNYALSYNTSVDLYNNKLNAVSDANNIGVWSPAYNFIFQANSVIESLEKSTAVSLSTKKQLTGEAKFVRAYWYFYLVNLYGDIPLAVTTDYTQNTNLSRAPVSNVYQQIIADLNEAQANLSATYVDVTDTVSTTERVRPTKWAAEALLARTYLYTKQWPNAEAMATQVINNTSLFNLPTNLNAVFLKNSSEAIWQLMVNSSNRYVSETSFFSLSSNPLTTSGSSVNTISSQLLSAFETGDNRKANWVSVYTTTSAPITAYYFANKYKASSSTISSNPSLAGSEYSTILRLGEQYLIRAEARTMQNSFGAAVSDLNVIRNRAGLPNYSGVMDQPSLLSAIAHERQAELFTEGHRWFDLKRTGTVDAVMTLASSQKGTTWQSYQQLYPIPVSDIQNSAGKIAQNPNY